MGGGKKEKNRCFFCFVLIVFCFLFFFCWFFEGGFLGDGFFE